MSAVLEDPNVTNEQRTLVHEIAAVAAAGLTDNAGKHLVDIPPSNVGAALQEAIALLQKAEDQDPSLVPASPEEFQKYHDALHRFEEKIQGELDSIARQ